MMLSDIAVFAKFFWKSTYCCYLVLVDRPMLGVTLLHLLLQQLNKSLLKIGEGLVHKTELKDFFSDLVEKVCACLLIYCLWGVREA